MSRVIAPASPVLAQRLLNCAPPPAPPPPAVFAEGTGRTLRLNWGGGKRGGGPSAPLPVMPPMAPPTMMPSQSEFALFVGDLPFDVNDTVLMAVFFARYPTCSSCKVRGRARAVVDRIVPVRVRREWPPFPLLAVVYVYECACACTHGGVPRPLPISCSHFE